jgi:hypothetical protein
MNYQRIYDEIIEQAKLRGLNKKLLKGYFEKHHIVPKCLGGLNENSNYVLLTGREHYLCHWLLWKTNKENHKLLCAYNRIVHGNKQYFERRLTSKQYEMLKIVFSKTQSLNNTGHLNPNFGTHKSDKTKMLISKGKIH